MTLILVACLCQGYRSGRFVLEMLLTIPYLQKQPQSNKTDELKRSYLVQDSGICSGSTFTGVGSAENNLHQLAQILFCGQTATDETPVNVP